MTRRTMTIRVPKEFRDFINAEKVKYPKPVSDSHVVGDIIPEIKRLRKMARF